MTTRTAASLPQSVQNWLGGLKRIKHKDTVAWVNEGWQPIESYHHDDWPVDELIFLLDLFRPAAREVRDWASNLDDERAAAVEGWLKANRPGRGRRTLFGVRFAVSRIFDSSCWSWGAIALSPDLALLCQFGGDVYRGPFGEVFGVIDRKHPVQSAALLLAANGAPEEMCLSDDHFPFHELSANGVSRTDVYRLVLAFYGYDGLDVCIRPDKEVRRFRGEDATAGFEEIDRLLGPRPAARRTR